MVSDLYFFLNIFSFSVARMMWVAGILAALGSITYPAISAFVSIHSTADQQGKEI
jgi:hypothetical protein